MEQEIATLVLNTFDISPSINAGDYYNTIVDNQYGTISDNRCNLTWKNINLLALLGTVYDRYETFNLYLYQISQTGAFGAVPSSAPFLLVDIKLNGLRFLNNTYNNTSRNNTDTVFLTSYLLNNNATAGTGTVTPMFNPTIFTFGKNTENVNINIDMKCTKDNNYPILAAPTAQILSCAFGQFNFMFKIKGIPTKTNNLINASRMNISL